MKTLGMLLIVWGHSGVAGITPPITHPFNFKQLGVAFFIFVLGFSLARENRTPTRVLYNRLFDIYAVGFPLTLLLSLVTWITIADINESNYAPFVLGVNVLFNHFPANPTTWYIGTYCHLLFFWFLLTHRYQVRFWWLPLSLFLEIITRACLMHFAGNFIAYMALPNWLTIFLLGSYVGQHNLVGHRSAFDKTDSIQPSKRLFAWNSPLWPFLALLGYMMVWTRLVDLFGITSKNPFGEVLADTPWPTLILTSAAVSLHYCVYTFLFFRLALALTDSAIVGFFARNTLVIFIIHMPLIYAWTPLYYPYVPQGLLRILVNTLLFFVLPALLSEIILRPLALKKRRDQLWSYLTHKREPTVA